MHLKQLSLLNFKNIEQALVEFSPTINALVGDNGAGKTNVIDAIHYLSLSKSMMAMTDRQAVRHNAPFFVVDGSFITDSMASEGVVCSFSVQQAKGVKSLKRNGKLYERLSDHVGVIPIVIVAPQDIALIYDGAEERRRFLNSFISQFDKEYLNALIRYNATLGQRNMLLKGSADSAMLDVYDMQLSQHAQTIYRRRTEVIHKMQPLVEQYYNTISGQQESISLELATQLTAPDSLAQMLADARQRDIALQHTSVGVHRDDLELKIEGLPLRKYGSQGQQKSYLIALKLAEHNIVSSLRDEHAILLLDDLFDKLDRGRVEQLLKIVSSKEFGQIFITDCNTARLEETLQSSDTPYSLYRVTNGQITKE